MRQLIDQVLASAHELGEYVRTLDRGVAPRSDPTWSSISQRAVLAQDLLARWLEETGDALAAGDVSAAGPALAYLEADPYYFGSGYARNRLAGRLARVPLTGPELSRARELVMAGVDGRPHCGQAALGRLARAVADNRLRRGLRERLHSVDPATARRALRILTDVRHPGLAAVDLRAARMLVLEDAGTDPFLAPRVERLARWLWTPQWRDELRDTARRHGPHRAGANRLVEAADRRVRRRPGP